MQRLAKNKSHDTLPTRPPGCLKKLRHRILPYWLHAIDYFRLASYGSMMLPPRQPRVFARLARCQLSGAMSFHQFMARL